MSEIILVKPQDKFWDLETLQGMFRFRHQVFHQSLGWDVETHQGMERDRFDELNPVYLIAKGSNNAVDGCWRLLPTTGPYMLSDTFPQLLQGSAAPHRDEVWELSRFAVASTGRGDLAQASLGSVTFEMIRCVVEFAFSQGIRSYVTVTSVALERLMKRAGIPLRRLGQGRAQRIGKVLTVACTIEINEKLCQLVGCHLHRSLWFYQHKRQCKVRTHAGERHWEKARRLLHPFGKNFQGERSAFQPLQQHR